MSIGKKEIKLLIVLGLLVYALLFYLIFINKYIPQINEINGKLSVARKQEQVLKNDLKNINELKADFESKNVVDERIDNYIYNDGDVTDCIDYMEKLEKLMGNRLTDVKISEPEEKATSSDAKKNTSTNTASDESLTGGSSDTTTQPSPSTNNGKKFYEMSVGFKASLTYGEISNLLNYIEGGTRRVRISKFTMEPPKDSGTGSGSNTSNGAKPTSTPTPIPGQSTSVPGTQYEITMTMDLYAINIGDADKLYQYSKNKFSRFGESSGVQFAVVSGQGGNTSTKGTPLIPSITSSSSDVIVNESGYLTAGENLEIYGINKSKDVFRSKNSGKTDVQLLLNDSTYTMYVYYTASKYRTISGDLPKRDIKVEINMNVPNTKENNNIKLNFKVINNSSSKVNIKLNDNSQRVKVLDRAGVVIRGDNKKEKVSIN